AGAPAQTSPGRPGPVRIPPRMPWTAGRSIPGPAAARRSLRASRSRGGSTSPRRCAAPARSAGPTSAPAGSGRAPSWPAACGRGGALPVSGGGARTAAGGRGAWRAAVAEALRPTAPLGWTDERAGGQRARPELAGDVVLVRKEADTPASYHLAATLDEAAD